MITTVKTSSVVQGMPKYRSMLAGNPAYAPPSFESIATATGTGSSNIITFSSIPSTFKHLQIRAVGRTSTAAKTRIIYVYPNGDTGTNYSYHSLIGDGGTSVAAAGGASTGFPQIGTFTGSTSTADIMGVAIIDILDYTSTSKYKTIRSFSGVEQNELTNTGRVELRSALWMSTSAISSLTIDGIGNFTTSTTFALYGIKEA